MQVSYDFSTKPFSNSLSTGAQHEKKYCLVGFESGELYGEPKLIYPKFLQKIWKRKLVWTELTKVWRSGHNRLRAFILNSVNGGYAVAIGGHIAFLPRSLRLDRKVFHGQWRFVEILNMNQKIGNIVVRELKKDGHFSDSRSKLASFAPKMQSKRAFSLSDLSKAPLKERHFSRKAR
uniref:Ribosomal protein S1 n=1 Tax=Gonatozygon brebissonii TaxID=184482 RepID=A0A6G9IF24_9VIRI|nr:ribosomal protein S1 [Gonatozygon brebissonii]QIQ23057.1 ribosomal protein S1 [Gonatozygon brebissonii]